MNYFWGQLARIAGSVPRFLHDFRHLPESSKVHVVYRGLPYPPRIASQRGLLRFLQFVYIIWLVYEVYISSLVMITGLGSNPTWLTHDSARIPLDILMIRISTLVIRLPYIKFLASFWCLTERLFTIVRKSLNYNTLQLLAQLPSEAFSEGGEWVGIGDCKPPS